MLCVVLMYVCYYICICIHEFQVKPTKNHAIEVHTDTVKISVYSPISKMRRENE